MLKYFVIYCLHDVAYKYHIPFKGKMDTNSKNLKSYGFFEKRNFFFSNRLDFRHMKTEIIFIRQCSGAGAGSLTFFFKEAGDVKKYR